MYKNYPNCREGRVGTIGALVLERMEHFTAALNMRTEEETDTEISEKAMHFPIAPCYYLRLSAYREIYPRLQFVRRGEPYRGSNIHTSRRPRDNPLVRGLTSGNSTKHHEHAPDTTKLHPADNPNGEPMDSAYGRQEILNKASTKSDDEHAPIHQVIFRIGRRSRWLPSLIVRTGVTPPPHMISYLEIRIR